MRVLLIEFNSAELTLRLAGALAGMVDDVCLMLPEREAEAHAHWLDPAVRFQPFDKPRLRDPVRQLLTQARIVRHVRRFNPDVIHFQKGHLWFNFALLWLRRYPLVVAIHDPRHHVGDRSSRKTPQAIMDLAYRRADRIIAHNQAMKALVVEQCRIAEDRIDVVPLLERGDARAAAGVSKEDNLVLFFGRLWPYKGLEYLIRAEPLVTARIPEARFVIAGRGEDLERYRQMMVHPDRFIVHNSFIAYDVREALFRRSSVVVLPYIEATQSGVIPVAYTHATPVIATAVGGLPEQVDHGRTGYLVPPRDEVALAEAIVRLLSDAELRRRMGRAARRKLETEWSAPVVARQTLAVYRRAIRDAATARTATAMRFRSTS